MRRSRKKKKLKKIFSIYNLAILVCISVIIASIFIIFEPDFGGTFANIKSSIGKILEKDEKEESNNIENNNDIKVVKASGKEITEKEARKMAKKQFKELNENVDVDDLEVLNFMRNGEEYFYVSSKENNCEIKGTTGEIIKINHIPVNQ